MHEHVYIDLSGLKSEDSRLDCLEDTVSEFKTLKDLGVGNVVEVTCLGMGRNVPYMQEAAQLSGINILYSTGFYQEKFHPPFLKEMTEAQIYALFVKEVTQGMDGSDVKASVIGEVGTSKDIISPAEERVFRAALRAHLDTGAALSTHCTLGTMGHQQVALFSEYTKNLSRIVIGHTDLTGDETYIQKMLDKGVNVAFDTVGKIDYMPDTWRADTLASLIGKGYGGQIVLSMDITRKSHFASRGGLGYAYLLQSFIPMLLERGVSSDAVYGMLEDNAKRILENREAI